jgi:sec-independent protein translocase protein TatA
MMGLSVQEMVIVGVVAILLFGKRLPEVAKTVGKYYKDFRKSLSDIQSQVDFTDSYNSTPTPSRSKPRRIYADDYEEVSAPKFVPPPAEQEEPPSMAG